MGSGSSATTKRTTVEATASKRSVDPPYKLSSIPSDRSAGAERPVQRVRSAENRHPALHRSQSDGSLTGQAGTLPGRSPRIDSTHSVKSARGSSYVGAYSIVAGFIKECQPWLPEERFSLLIESLEELARPYGGSRGQGISSASRSEHFAGQAQELKLVLPSLGIVVRDEATPANLGSMCFDNFDGVRIRRLKTCPASPITELQFKSEDVDKIFGTINFDSSLRGFNMAEDSQLLSAAFSHPVDVISCHRLNEEKLCLFFTELAGRYTNAPYHNWRHALDVFQFSYLHVGKGNAEKYFLPQDILALYVSALAHDVGHFGMNNAFLVNTGAPLALTYNDRSPLENMHCAVLFDLLAKPKINIFEGMPATVTKNIRSKMIDAILATDMSMHFEFVDRFSAKAFDFEALVHEESHEAESSASSADRRMFLQAFLHAADLGHTCRPWAIHTARVIALEEEFFRQGDKEAMLGLPVLPMMNRTKDSMATGQGFFLDKIIAPMMEPYAIFLTEEESSNILHNLAKNRDRWAFLLLKHGQLKACELIAVEDREAVTGVNVPSQVLPGEEKSKTLGLNTI